MKNRPRIKPRILEWLVALREVQSATGEELRPFFGQTLLPSVLDRALSNNDCHVRFRVK